MPKLPTIEVYIADANERLMSMLVDELFDALVKELEEEENPL